MIAIPSVGFGSDILRPGLLNWRLRLPRQQLHPRPHNVISSRVRCLRSIPSIHYDGSLTDSLGGGFFSAAVSTKSKRQLSLKKTLAPKIWLRVTSPQTMTCISILFGSVQNFMICVPRGLKNVFPADSLFVRLFKRIKVTQLKSARSR
jgi:hypothetical protein